MSTTTAPVRHDLTIPDVFQSLINVRETVDRHGFSKTIHHLVHLRASQINGCAFCVKMHTREARQDGESNDRLDRLVVWTHVSDFSEAEKAALAWTEALTVLDPKTDYAPLRARLRAVFSDKEISVLTSTIAMINLWNRIQISGH
ncbi:carboxymuconolactone decarboxylase family protein [Polaromonas sp. SM01]|uniref:carboxymuconolactone decarboxylase family protein n=1 Tax=Polaromonas sp. SM01 TaxID=3085630 RepID=UPI00298238B7|nr:carboxymuconolactone decarboxylase family protein [Polaromonas sp. SM01]MDW5442176.1 carboxymuconolactone decarboxylase family protein [Polaromonas sp. SM01]